MLESLDKLADAEIERDPYLLSKSRQNATALIEGAAERSDVYKAASVFIDQLIAKYTDTAEASMREIRISDVGEEAAREERINGSKTEEDYARESEARKQERTRVRVEAKEVIRQKELAIKKKEEEERRRRREEEDARERERDEADAKRRREREEAEEKEREERRERRRREDEGRYRPREDDRYRDHRDRDRSRDRERDRDRDRDSRRSDRRSVDPPSRPRSPKPSVVTEKDLEEIALQELLKEGQMAAKSRSRYDSDKDKPELARKLPPPKATVPRDPTSSRISRSEVPRSEHHESSRAPSRQSSPPTRLRDRSRDRDIDDRSTRRRTPSDVGSRRGSINEDSERYSRYRDDRDRDDRRSRIPPQGDRYVPGGTSTVTERPERRYDSYRADRQQRRRSTSRRRSRSRGRDADERPVISSARSRSRTRRSIAADTKERSPVRVKRGRDPSPTGIDRYVPGGRDKDKDDIGKESAKESKRESIREDRPRDDRARDDRPRFRDNDRYVPSARDGDSATDKDRDRSRDDERRDRDRDRDTRPRDRSRDRDRDDRHPRREYERYRPGGNNDRSEPRHDRYVPGKDRDQNPEVDDPKAEEGEVKDKELSSYRDDRARSRSRDRSRSRRRYRSRSRSRSRRPRSRSRSRRRDRSRSRSRRRDRSYSRGRRDRKR